MLMHTIEYWGCRDTVREFALEVESGEKSLAAPGTQTRVSIASGVLVGRSELSPLLRT